MNSNKEQVFQIRYNTVSTDDSNRWRLLCDGDEIQVSDIIINAETKTTKDRLNTFLRCKNVFLSQAKRVWTIHGSNGSFPYEDGMEVHEDGHIVTPSNAKNMYSSDIINKVDKTQVDPKFYELYGFGSDEEKQ
jgi:hypothetical protein